MHYKVLHFTHSQDPFRDLEPRSENAIEYYQWYSHNSDRYFETEEEAIQAERNLQVPEDEIAVSHLNPNGQRDFGQIGGRFGPALFTTNGPVCQCKKSDLLTPPEPEVFDAYYWEEENKLVFRTIYDHNLKQFILNPLYEEGIQKAFGSSDNSINIYQLALHC